MITLFGLQAYEDQQLRAAVWGATCWSGPVSSIELQKPLTRPALSLAMTQRSPDVSAGCLPWISIDGAGRKEVRDRIYAAALVLCLKAERRAARCQSQHRNGVCSPLTRLADTHPEPVAAEFRRFYQRPV